MPIRKSKPWWRRLKPIPCLILLGVVGTTMTFCTYSLAPEPKKPVPVLPVEKPPAAPVAPIPAPPLPQPEPEVRQAPPAPPPLAMPAPLPPEPEPPAVIIPQPLPLPPPASAPSPIPAPRVFPDNQPYYRPDLDNPPPDDRPAIILPPAPRVIEREQLEPPQSVQPELRVAPPPPTRPRGQYRQLPPIAGGRLSPEERAAEDAALRRCRVALAHLSLGQELTDREVQTLLVDCQPRKNR